MFQMEAPRITTLRPSPSQLTVCLRAVVSGAQRPQDPDLWPGIWGEPFPPPTPVHLRMAAAFCIAKHRVGPGHAWSVNTY